MPTSNSYNELLEENKRLKNEISRLKNINNQPSKHPLIPGGSLLYSLIQSLPVNIYAKNPSGKFIFVNDFYCTSVGKTSEEIIGKSDFDIHPADLARKYLLDDKRIMDSKIVESIEEDWCSIGGEINHVSVIKSPIYDFDHNKRQERILGTIGVFWDITKRRKAEEALRKSEERYRAILENIAEGYFEIDTGYNISFCNKAFCSIIESTLPDLLETSLLDFAKADDVRLLKSFLNLVLFQNSNLETGKFQFQNNSGKQLTLDLSISPRQEDHSQIPDGIRGVIRDISDILEAEKEKAQLQKQLQQAQKLESIGTLAGGIAHDFNNILFIIQGYTDLALNDLKKKRDPWQKLGRIKDSCSRAKDLIEQILSFARHSEKQRIPIDIRPIIKESMQLLRSALPATIKVSSDLETNNTHYVIADPTEINQIIMNLGANAGHAMAGAEGKLRVTLNEIVIDDSLSPLQPGLKEGTYLKLSVSDNGKGIPEKDYPRIFEPFFTTKKIAEGTGLGLSVVHGIITGMEGRIFVESRENKGTTFRIFFPVTDKSIITAVEKPKKIPKGTNEHILLVDDNKPLLNMLANMLTELNYSCTPCNSGAEAIELFTKQPNRYDLLFTDQTMQGLTGDALSLAVRTLRPDIPIILCTGYSEQMDHEKAKKIGIDIFLEKPIMIENLAESLYRLLHTC